MANLTEKIQGLREAKAAFKALPDLVRDQMLHATETTVREIARGAQARILASPSVQTRALHDSIAWAVTKTNGRGRVGVSTGSHGVKVDGRRQRRRGVLQTDGGVKIPSAYAHFIEFGTRHAPAEPFMIPAAESQKQPYLERCKRAGRDIERLAPSLVGGRFL